MHSATAPHLLLRGCLQLLDPGVGGQRLASQLLNQAQEGGTVARLQPDYRDRVEFPMLTCLRQGTVYSVMFRVVACVKVKLHYAFLSGLVAWISNRLGR